MKIWMMLLIAAALAFSACGVIYAYLERSAETQIGDPDHHGRDVLKDFQAKDGPARSP